MIPSNVPRFLAWARQIQALAQSEFHYAHDDFQRERCRRLMEISAEMISENSDVEYSTALRSFENQAGYATPKIDVRAAVFREGKLLLVRERIDGGWTLPGGWADVGDVPSGAAEREVLEEAGFVVEARRIIGVYDSNRARPLELFHAFKILFLCELMGGEARPSAETIEVAFFGRDEIPSPFSGERTRSRHIEDAFAVHSTPELPTFFD
jgi:ADP-ribose pyrophosphatase YjhB (NUDIX family)